MLEGKYSFDGATAMKDGNVILSINVLKVAPELEDLGRIISNQRYTELMMRERFIETAPKTEYQEYETTKR